MFAALTASFAGTTPELMHGAQRKVAVFMQMFISTDAPHLPEHEWISRTATVDNVLFGVYKDGEPRDARQKTQVNKLGYSNMKNWVQGKSRRVIIPESRRVMSTNAGSYGLHTQRAAHDSMQAVLPSG